MPDREKVIKAAEICLRYIDDGDCPTECPYFDLCTKYEKRVVFQPLIRDALALLKEQEAVKPVEVNNKETGCFKCGNCGAVVLSYSYPGIITDKYRSYHQFCGKCGRRVLWEGR